MRTLASRLNGRWLVGLFVVCLVVTLAAPTVTSASAAPAAESSAAGKSSHNVSGKQLRDYRRLTVSTSQARFDKGVDNQGWWAKDFRNGDGNDNYAVGECGTCGSPIRDFFTFKLPDVKGKVVAARLVVRRYHADGTDATETLDLYDVHTPARKLNNNGRRDSRVYRDLGTGTRYGRFRVATQNVDPRSVVGFWLNHAALSNINAASGRYFSVGGRVTSTKRSNRQLELLFSGSHSNGMQELRLYVKPKSP